MENSMEAGLMQTCFILFYNSSCSIQMLTTITVPHDFEDGGEGGGCTWTLISVSILVSSRPSRKRKNLEGHRDLIS